MSDSQVTTLDDAPVIATKTSKAAKAVAAATEGSNFYNVTVHATGDDVGSTAVDMCIDGFLYQLPRGVPCRVPSSVVEGLRNSVITTYKVNGNAVVEQNIPRFPYSAEPA